MLWDPVADGSTYLAELAEAHVAARKEAFGPRWETESRVRALAMEEARNEALGYPLTPDLRTQLGALVPASFRGARAERVTLLGARSDNTWSTLAGQLAGGGIDVRTRTISTSIAWLMNDMLSDSLIPPDDLRSLVAALSEDA